MIRLTRLNRSLLVLNADLIEHIEVTPDTVISMTTGQKITVRESADEVVERVIEFRRRLLRAEPLTAGQPAIDSRQKLEAVPPRESAAAFVSGEARIA